MTILTEIKIEPIDNILKEIKNEPQETDLCEIDISTSNIKELSSNSCEHGKIEEHSGEDSNQTSKYLLENCILKLVKLSVEEISDWSQNQHILLFSDYLHTFPKILMIFCLFFRKPSNLEPWKT